MQKTYDFGRNSPVRFLVVLLAVVLCACPYIAFKDTLRDPTYRGKPKKMLIYVVSRNAVVSSSHPGVSGTFEDQLVEKLEEHGVTGLAGYEFLSDAQIVNTDELRRLVKKKGVDTVFIAGPTNRKSLDRLQPGEISYASSVYEGRIEDNDRFSAFVKGAVNSTGTYAGKKILMELVIYDVKLNRPIWSALSKTYIGTCPWTGSSPWSAHRTKVVGGQRYLLRGRGYAKGSAFRDGHLHACRHSPGDGSHWRQRSLPARTRNSPVPGGTLRIRRVPEKSSCTRLREVRQSGSCSRTSLSNSWKNTECAALAGHEFLPDSLVVKREAIMQVVREKGIDAVFIAGPTNRKDLESLRPGETSYAGGLYEGQTESYDKFFAFVNGAVSSAGTYAGEDVTLEMVLYDVKSNKRIWSALARWYIWDSAVDEIQPAVGRIMEKLSADKIIP